MPSSSQHVLSEMSGALRVLSLMAIFMISIPFGLVAWAFATMGWSAPLWILEAIAMLQIHVTLAILPAIILVLVFVTFLVAVVRRASWGPRVVGMLAILFGLISAIEKLAVPLILTLGNLPLASILITMPGIVAPIFFAVAFRAYLHDAEDASLWFRREHTINQAGRVI